MDIIITKGIILNECARFRKNEVMCWLSYEAPCLLPERGMLGMHTLAVRHTCSQNLGVVKILHFT